MIRASILGVITVGRRSGIPEAADGDLGAALKTFVEGPEIDSLDGFRFTGSDRRGPTTTGSLPFSGLKGTESPFDCLDDFGFT